MAVGNRLQRTTTWQPPLLDRTVGQYGHIARGKRRQKIELGTTAGNIVQDLIPSRSLRRQRPLAGGS